MMITSFMSFIHTDVNEKRFVSKVVSPPVSHMSNEIQIDINQLV